MFQNIRTRIDNYYAHLRQLEIRSYLLPKFEGQGVISALFVVYLLLMVMLWVLLPSKGEWMFRFLLLFTAAVFIDVTSKYDDLKMGARAVALAYIMLIKQGTAYLKALYLKLAKKDTTHGA